MTAKFTIRGTLPNLNDYITAERTNKYQAAQLKRRYEAVVIHASRSLGKTRFDRPVYMRYSWYEPNRRRDKDNIAAFGRKVIQDALVRANILKNDGWKEIVGFEDRFYVDKEKPRIVVEMIEVDA